MPSNKKFKILFVTPEVTPFAKTGGVADVSSALPKKLLELGHQVRIVLPKYGSIDERIFKIHEVVRLKDLKTKVAKTEVEFSIRSSFLVGAKARVQIYFLDNKKYFTGRRGIYSSPKTGKIYEDNDERFILFARAIFPLIEQLGWVPDIIHCNDWQTGLLPVYLKTLYKDFSFFKNAKTVFTIHNLGNQGIFPKSSFDKTGLPEELKSEKGILNKNKLNFLKAGIKYADVVTTVSPTYAEEICTIDEMSYGLKDVLCSRRKDIYGILNGIDPRVWNPEKDKFIPKKYSIKNLKAKALNKVELGKAFGFETKSDVPVIGLISHLTDQKGFNLIKKAFTQLVKLPAQFVLLGTGESKYETFCKNAAKKYKNFFCKIGFDEKLAHLIEAGADMFLMPSQYEPCGLNQMYSQVYGTVPIVRATGGLKDTVEPFDKTKGNGTGFVFTNYAPEDLIGAVKQAIEVFVNDQKTWQKLQKKGMKADFSWQKSTKKYINLYKKIYG